MEIIFFHLAWLSGVINHEWNKCDKILNTLQIIHYIKDVMEYDKISNFRIGNAEDKMDFLLVVWHPEYGNVASHKTPCTALLIKRTSVYGVGEYFRQNIH